MSHLIQPGRLALSNESELGKQTIVSEFDSHLAPNIANNYTTHHLHENLIFSVEEKN